jgi:D-methionine transport system ATP-binding protein
MQSNVGSDNTDAIVRLDAVRRSFGPVTALDGVDLRVNRGETFGIIGRSGAGKSTLIRSINALERVDSGRVIVNGQDLSGLDEDGLNRVRRNIGMIFQHFNLLSMKTVFENVELPLKLAGQLRGPRADAVWRMLDMVGLRDKAAVYPAKLSGGQKQRVGIARALVTGCSLLLSDEATSALDPETTLSILQLLKDLKASLGVTIILITHEMSVIREVCDHVAVLDQGRIVEQGAVWEVFGEPRTGLTRRLLRNVRPPLPQSLQAQLSGTPIAAGQVLLRLSSADLQREPGALALLTGPHWQGVVAHAEIDSIQAHRFGTVTLSLPYRGELQQAALLAELKPRLADLEVLGYVGG